MNFWGWASIALACAPFIGLAIGYALTRIYREAFDRAFIAKWRPGDLAAWDRLHPRKP